MSNRRDSTYTQWSSSPYLPSISFLSLSLLPPPYLFSLSLLPPTTTTTIHTYLFSPLSLPQLFEYSPWTRSRGDVDKTWWDSHYQPGTVFYIFATPAPPFTPDPPVPVNSPKLDTHPHRHTPAHTPAAWRFRTCTEHAREAAGAQAPWDAGWAPDALLLLHFMRAPWCRQRGEASLTWPGQSVSVWHGPCVGVHSLSFTTCS